MGRDFSVIKANVGTDIQDTSTAMATIIGRYINRRYMQILRAVNLDYINEDYTISVTAGTQDYALPTDFKTELYAIDTTNGNNLTRISWQDLSRDYEDDLSTSGDAERYIIFRDDSDAQKIRFHYVPNASITVSLPHYVTPSELSADADEPILGLEDLLELGATADAWRYKKQFSKAQQMEVLYNQMYADFIWKQENQPNNIVQFQPVSTSRDSIY